MIRLGRYRHYRGRNYIVTGSALDYTTGNTVVIYVDEVSGVVYTRNIKNFSSVIDMDEEQIPRFRFLGEANEVQRR